MVRSAPLTRGSPDCPSCHLTVLDIMNRASGAPAKGLAPVTQGPAESSSQLPAESPPALLLLARLWWGNRLAGAWKCIQVSTGLASVQGLVHLACPLASLDGVLFTPCVSARVGHLWSPRCTVQILGLQGKISTDTGARAVQPSPGLEMTGALRIKP